MDYNIYIHSVDGGANSDQTIPWTKGEGGTKAWSDEGGYEISAKEAIRGAAHPSSLIQKGIGAVAKAVPWVAIAIAVIKACDQIYSTALAFATAESGDYAAQADYDNAKTILQKTFDPLSATLGVLREDQARRIAANKAAMHRGLVGSSDLPFQGGAGV